MQASQSLTATVPTIVAAISGSRRIPSTPPDFLYAALDISACAAFFTESRMKLIFSTNPNRKFGYVLGYFQPDLSKLDISDGRKRPAST
jgi:hypothetical protein